MEAAAGEGIAALQRDRRVARALDAEGGVAHGLIFLVAGIDVDIVQRHVEGAVFDLVDDLDDVVGGGVGDAFGHGHEVFDRVIHDFGRLDLGLIVVIGVGDIEGWAGVRELASQHRAVAGLGLFRGISLVFLAAGGVAGLVLVFLAAGGAVRLVLVFLAAGGAVRLVLVFLAAVGRRHVALGVAVLRAGGAVGLVLVFLAAGGVAGLVLVFLAAGGAVRLVLVFLAAGGAAGLVLVFLAAGGAAGLVLVFLAAGGVAGLVLVFLAAAVRRAVALGVAEVGLFFGFAVFFCFERGQIGLGGRL